jgi:hypothetical protein
LWLGQWKPAWQQVEKVTGNAVTDAAVTASENE